jgi:hypothetical protein
VKNPIKYPVTSGELRDAGFVYDDEGICRGHGCGERISWYITPGGKKIPMSTVIVGTLKEGNRMEKLQPHFADCPAAEDFRKK